MYNFDNQVVMITGAGRGLGRAYTLALAARGATVIAVDNGCDVMGEGTDSDYITELKEVARDMGAEVIGHCIDVTDQAAMAQLVDATYAEFGRIDGLICNAGIMLPQDGVQQGLELYQQQMNVNHYATVALVQQVLPKMQQVDQGRIVVTGGLSPIYGEARLMGYAASAAANMGFVRCLSRELADSNVKVNVIVPANFSRMSEQLEWPYDYQSMTPDLVAPAVLWLLASNAPNGLTVSVGGGYYSLIEPMESEGATLDLNDQRPQAVARLLGNLSHAPKTQVFQSFESRMRHILKLLMLKRS
ncbi:SDR family NAD(P)-dependent oxidoreductase [uncultured Ferrimonas sp.]|uniref:SDR family NAD(P)-dependent oxidoreductase n=1 Tax=uncultured Ferrimonas sp. TaxID=432640 RepID=UPI002611F09E|nr:SDR family NAD(P)-dependent oxidoreductase [uncultured Ferrimonas sp.]